MPPKIRPCDIIFLHSEAGKIQRAFDYFDKELLRLFQNNCGFVEIEIPFEFLNLMKITIIPEYEALGWKVKTKRALGVYYTDPRAGDDELRYLRFKHP